MESAGGSPADIRREHRRVLAAIESRWQTFTLAHRVLQFRLINPDVSDAAKRFHDSLETAKLEFPRVDPKELVDMGALFSSEGTPKSDELERVARKQFSLNPRKEFQGMFTRSRRSASPGTNPKD